MPAKPPRCGLGTGKCEGFDRHGLTPREGTYVSPQTRRAQCVPLTPNSADRHELLKHLVIAVTAGLPALAIATYGIRVIGDFEGIATRSQRRSQPADCID
jgi:hypothetical protein